MTTDQATRQAILDSLEPLLLKAEREGLWLHCDYQDLWFSPEQLRQEHAKGSFLWGPVNWELLEPPRAMVSPWRRFLIRHLLNLAKSLSR